MSRSVSQSGHRTMTFIPHFDDNPPTWLPCTRVTLYLELSAIGVKSSAEDSMKRLLIFWLTLLVADTCSAQSTKAGRAADPSKTPAVVPDAALAAALRPVSAAPRRPTLAKLGSCRNSSTPSAGQPAP